MKMKYYLLLAGWQHVGIDILILQVGKEELHRGSSIGIRPSKYDRYFKHLHIGPHFGASMVCGTI